MKTKENVIIETPSILGLRPTGVEQLPAALLAAGLAEAIESKYIVSLGSPKYNQTRDPETRILNGQAIRDYSIRLANTVESALQAGDFPVILGGDCSIIIGCLLGLKRIGTHGLLFIDGHTDFYMPEESPTGEVADMDLAIVSGRGPALLTNIENAKPLVRDAHIIALGARDTIQTIKDNGIEISKTDIHLFPYSTITKAEQSIPGTVADLLKRMDTLGTWIHIDVDVLNDEIMSSVDYRQPGGISPALLIQIIQAVILKTTVTGLSLSIYNPVLDPDKSQAQLLVNVLKQSLMH